MKEFKYQLLPLNTRWTKRRGGDRYRLNESVRMIGGLGCLWRSRSLSITAKAGMLQGIVIPRVSVFRRMKSELETGGSACACVDVQE